MSSLMSAGQRRFHIIVGVGGFLGVVTFLLWVWAIFFVTATGLHHPLGSGLATDLFSLGLILTYVIGFVCALRCLFAAWRNELSGRFRRFALVFGTYYLTVCVAITGFAASVFVTESN